MKLVGANRAPQVVGLDPLPGESHYLIGSDPAGWRTHVKHYGRVAYRDVYPGIDLIFYSRAGRLEYDFDVQPGADEGAIELAFDGMDEASIDDRGDLVLRVPGGQLRHRRPSSFEGGESDRRPLETGFSGKAHGRFGFRVKGRDRRRHLKIDPELEWIRLAGSDNDWSYDVAVDHEGNTYLTGQAWSADFPSVGGMPPVNVASGEAFVLKLGPQQQIIYSTFFGAANTFDVGLGIGVDALGQAVVSGNTYGNVAEVAAAHPGKCATDSGLTGFLAKLKADGASFRFSTCLPADTGEAVVVEPLGSAIVVGSTVADAFIGRYLPTGQYVFAQTWGGSSGDSALDVAVDAQGHAFVVGQTTSSNLPGTAEGLQPTLPTGGGGFVAEFTPTGGLVRATYLGGSRRTRPNGVAADRFGNVYVTGWTESPDFPLAAATRTQLRANPWGPVTTAFVTKLRPNLRELVYSTFYAQENVPVDGTIQYVHYEEAVEVAVDSAGNAYVIGQALTYNETTKFSGVYAWLAGFDPAGQPTDNALLDPTANGDEAYGIAVTDSGELYIVGHVDYLWACVWVDGVGQRCYDVSDSDIFLGRIPGKPGGEIVITPSTTRWRPQKDTTTPAKINFHSDRSLKAATITIIGPSAVAPIQVSPPTPQTDFEVQWNGPWLTDPANPGSYLLPGDYTLSVTGTTLDDQTVQSESGDANAKISLVEVKEVRLCGSSGSPTACAPLNADPSLDIDPPVPALNDWGQNFEGTESYGHEFADRRGGGKRIFADAVPPGAPNNIVKVVATITPAIDRVPVYFHMLDADDPALLAPEDLDGDADHLKVHDNRGDRDGVGASSPTMSALSDSTGLAVSLHTVSLQPGDNYRVAASTSPNGFADFTAYQPSDTGELRHASKMGPDGLPLPLSAGEQTLVSPVLTVWRTLHVRMNSMGPIPSAPNDPNYAERNFVRGDITAVQSATTGTSRFVLGHAREGTDDTEGGPDETDEGGGASDMPLRDGSKDLSFCPGDRCGNGRFENGVLCIGRAATGRPLGCGGPVRIEGLVGNGIDFVDSSNPLGTGILVATLSAAGAPTVETRVVEWDSTTGEFRVEPAVAQDGAYAGGTLRIADVTWRIANSAGGYIAVVPDATATLPYVLVDDDALPMPASLLRSKYMTAQSDAPQENIFAQAYVRIAYNLVSGLVPPFARNVPATGTNLAAKAQLEAGRAASPGDTPGFWEAYVQFGYQPDASADADPDGSGTTDEAQPAPKITGITPDLVPTWGSLIFAEVSRDATKGEFSTCDFTTALSKTIAHEVAHQFGAEHPKAAEDGGIMAPGCAGDFENWLNVAARAKVRER